MAINDDIIYSLDGTNTDLIVFIPYILQDLFEIGSDPQIITQLIKTNIPETMNKRIIDLGCGKGAVSIEIVNQLGMYTTGIDGMKSFIDDARKTVKESGNAERCFFLVDDIKNFLSASQEKFDIAIWGSVGNILGNCKETLESISQVLKSDGYIIYDDGYVKPEYKNEFPDAITKEELMKQISESGFSLMTAIKFDDKRMQELNCANNIAIQKRCDELSNKFPDKKHLFEEYVNNQLHETENLNNKFVSQTILLQKNLIV